MSEFINGILIGSVTDAPRRAGIHEILANANSDRTGSGQTARHWDLVGVSLSGGTPKFTLAIGGSCHHFTPKADQTKAQFGAEAVDTMRKLAEDSDKYFVAAGIDAKLQGTYADRPVVFERSGTVIKARFNNRGSRLEVGVNTGENSDRRGMEESKSFIFQLEETINFLLENLH